MEHQTWWLSKEKFIFYQMNLVGKKRLMLNKKSKVWLAIIFLLFILLLNSCKAKTDNFQDRYLRALSDVEGMIYEKDKGFYVDDMLNSFIFLSVCSGKETRLEDFHHVAITNEDLKKDIAYWKCWFNKHQNDISIEEADSLVKLYHLGKLRLKDSDYTNFYDCNQPNDFTFFDKIKYFIFVNTNAKKNISE